MGLDECLVFKTSPGPSSLSHVPAISWSRAAKGGTGREAGPCSGR